MPNIKSRLEANGLKQVWLLQRLRNMNVKLQPPELSSIIRGTLTTPKANHVIALSETILNEYEEQTNGNE